MREGGGIPVDCAQSNFSIFFFFLLVRNVRDLGWVPLHIFTCATFDADGAPEKKCRSAGGNGGTCPPTFFQVGDTISNVPPPPTFLG